MRSTLCPQGLQRHSAVVPKTSAAGSKGVPRAQREQQILDAAASEFSRYGFAGAALSGVAALAGVSRQLVLSYFGSKDGLYVACVERAGSSLIDRIERVVAAGEPPRQMATATLAAIFEALEHRPQDWNVIMDRTQPVDGTADTAAQGIRAVIEDQAARGVANLASLHELTDPEDAAVLTDVWISMVTALVDYWLRHPEHSAASMSERSSRVLTALIGEL